MTTESVRGAGSAPLTDEQMAQTRKVLDGINAALERWEETPWRVRVARYLLRNPGAKAGELVQTCGINHQQARRYLEGAA